MTRAEPLLTVAVLPAGSVAVAVTPNVPAANAVVRVADQVVPVTVAFTV